MCHFVDGIVVTLKGDRRQLSTGCRKLMLASQALIETKNCRLVE